MESMSQPPYQDVRINEKSTTLTGRLAGLLFADQGAEVCVDRSRAAPDEHDVYLDRQITVPHAAILAALGYTAVEVDRLPASGIIGPVEWFHREPAQPRAV
jgi:hypothetical protein